jgi:hypothetical protein
MIREDFVRIVLAGQYRLRSSMRCVDKGGKLLLEIDGFDQFV